MAIFPSFFMNLYIYIHNLLLVLSITNTLYSSFSHNRGIELTVVYSCQTDAGAVGIPFISSQPNPEFALILRTISNSRLS